MDVCPFGGCGGKGGAHRGREGGERMNYTENYRLNQWDPEDRLLREDFNRDNANVESGLVSLKQDLQTEVQNREAAVTAAKQEASQALTAAAGSLESSKADKTALAQLQALVDAMPFVKLREVTVGTSVNQVDVDVEAAKKRRTAQSAVKTF